MSLNNNKLRIRPYKVGQRYKKVNENDYRFLDEKIYTVKKIKVNCSNCFTYKTNGCNRIKIDDECAFVSNFGTKFVLVDDNNEFEIDENGNILKGV